MQVPGASVEAARIQFVNTLVAIEVFYLFSVGELRTPSLTWQRVIGTRPVLISLIFVTVARLPFTYAPFIEDCFDTRPLSLMRGVATACMSVTLFAVLKLGKRVLQRAFAQKSRLDQAPQS